MYSSNPVEWSAPHIRKEIDYEKVCPSMKQRKEFHLSKVKGVSLKIEEDKLANVANTPIVFILRCGKRDVFESCTLNSIKL